MDIETLWEEMIFEIGSIDKTLKDKDKSVRVGGGNRFADILFIGDDPELYQDEDIRVNVGSSGEFLAKLLDTLEITPDDFYITTLTKSKKRFKDFFEEDQELLLEMLNMQISLINPRLIVVFGKDVANLLLNREINFIEEKSKIFSWIGDIKMLITYDPGFALKSRNSQGKKSTIALEFWNDLKAIKNFTNENL